MKGIWAQKIGLGEQIFNYKFEKDDIILHHFQNPEKLLRKKKFFAE